MREAGLQTKYKERFVITTKSKNSSNVADNVLNRAFKAEKPNQKWVSDITYIPTREGWLYLAVVLDLFSRMIVGWAFGTSLETNLVLDALGMATTNRKPKATDNLLHHSDRGAQRPCPLGAFYGQEVRESRVSKGINCVESDL